VTEPLGDAFPDTETDAQSGRKRLVLFAGAGVVLAALAFGAYTLLGASDAVPDNGSALPPSKLPSHSASAPHAVVTPTPIASATEPIRLDPFKPLYPPKPTPAPTVAPVATGAPGTGGVGGVPGGVIGGVIGGVPGTPGATGPGVKQNVVKLIAITGTKIPTVTVSVDGVMYTGAAGTMLGSFTSVVSIRADSGSATFQLGEATFDLHIGQSYTN
jgi:hypothetical protein